MIFIIVPDYPQILSWKSIYKKVQKKILGIYGSRFSVHKLYISEYFDVYEFKRINFAIKNDYDLCIASSFNKLCNTEKELDNLLESQLKELDNENSVCIIDRSFYPTISRFMEPNIHIEFFRIVQDGTDFQFINSSVVSLKEFGTYKKEEPNHEIHSIHTIK